jgi:hypothetical protein
MRELRIKYSRSVRWGLAVTGLVLSFVLWPVNAPQAQRGGSETPVNITGVTTHTKGQDAVVSFSGDGALARAQTWQDDEGFHVVVYKGQNALRAGLPRGVKTRRVGDSLELVVPVKAGGNVYVQPRFNQLDLVVGGGLQAGAQMQENARQAHAATAQQASERGEQSTRKGRAASTQDADEVSAREPGKRKQSEVQEVAQTANTRSQASAATGAQSDAQSRAAASASQQAQNMLPSSYQGGAQPVQSNQQGASAPVEVAQLNTPPAPQTGVQMPVAAAATTTSALNFPLTVLGLCCTGGIVAFLFLYRRQRKAADEDGEETEETSTALTRPAPKALSKTETKTETGDRPSTVGLEPHPHGDRRGDARRKNLGRRASDKQSGVAVAAPVAQAAAEKPERRHE